MADLRYAPGVAVTCPKCEGPLERVVQKRPKMLNDDQFDAIKGGDWFCRACPKDDGYHFAYFADRDVVLPDRRKRNRREPAPHSPEGENADAPTATCTACDDPRACEDDCGEAFVKGSVEGDARYLVGIVAHARHVHERSPDDDDRCGACGHDIRHPIHIRSNEGAHSNEFLLWPRSRPLRRDDNRKFTYDRSRVMGWVLFLEDEYGQPRLPEAPGLYYPHERDGAEREATRLRRIMREKVHVGGLILVPPATPSTGEAT